MGMGRVLGIIVYKEEMREGISRHSMMTADGFESEVVGFRWIRLWFEKAWKLGAYV
jgi:hypothetical protein